MNGVTHRDYKTKEKSKWQGDRNIMTVVCIVIQDYCLNSTYLTFTKAKQSIGVHYLVLFSHNDLSKNKSIFPI